MNFRSIIFVICVVFASPNFATSKIVAIDGASGFVGKYLTKSFTDQSSTLRLGFHKQPAIVNEQVFVGEIYDPEYLKSFLKGVDVYYQVAAIAGTMTDQSLESYILTNSIAPYLASRINKSMTMISVSSIAIHDVDEDDAIQSWAKKFVAHMATVTADVSKLTSDKIIADLRAYLRDHPAPELRLPEYYSFSKLLSEKLLFKSARSRKGNIYVVRPGLIIGDDIRNKKANTLLRNILYALFENDNRIDVYNNTNHYSPMANLKNMLFYIANSQDEFPKFEIFDAGWVAMPQHDFVQKLFSASHQHPRNIRLIDESNFQRKVVMFQNDKVSQFYPKLDDIDQAIDEMVDKYQDDD